ncbi:MAG: GAF domain-containing protein, partial [Candidatus Eremiobacteraeota bacterium]|nr:GAF domain-containing protein [Candidatus Eremiobacteraeota bacterium]
HRTLVFLGSDGQLTVRAMRNFPKAEFGDEAIAQLVNEVEHKGKAVLVLDAHLDERFRGLPQPTFRAALCAPILREGRQIGLLYADAPQPGAFSYAHLSELEAYGAELGTSLEPERVRATPPPPPEGPAVSLWLQVVCGLAGLILVLGMILGWGKKPPPPAPKSKLATLETAGPDTIARSFLGALQAPRLGPAYEMLSPRLRDKLTPEQFDQRVKTWRGKGKNAWELQNRRPVVEEQSESRCLVGVERVGTEQAKSWRWELIKTPTGWVLDRLAGGPVLD